jgi:hypothetical protein
MAIAFVQVAQANSNSVAFSSNNTAGNLLVCAIASGGNVTNVTDTAGNTWTKLEDTDDAGSPLYADLWYTADCLGGANTVSLSGGFGGFESIAVAEFSGIAAVSPADQSSGAQGDLALLQSPDSGDVTPTEADELLVGVICNSVGKATTWTNTFNEVAETTNGRNVSLAYLIVDSIATWAAEGTLPEGGTTPWAALIGTFKAVAGSSPVGGLVGGKLAGDGILIGGRLVS